MFDKINTTPESPRPPWTEPYLTKTVTPISPTLGGTLNHRGVWNGPPRETRPLSWRLVVSLLCALPILLTLVGCDRGGGKDGKFPELPDGLSRFEGSGSFRDEGGGTGPAGPGISAGSSPAQVGGTYSSAAGAIQKAVSGLESAGQTFTAPQKKVFDDTVSLLERIGTHYGKLSVNSPPDLVLGWLLARNAHFEEMAKLAQEAKAAEIDWLWQLLREMSLRTDLLRFFSPGQHKNAFVALREALEAFVAEAATLGYFFIGIAAQIWKERVTMAGLTATRPLHQCFAAPLLLFFPYADSGCAGAQNLGAIGYIGETQTARSPTPLRWLFSGSDVVATRNEKEVEALNPLYVPYLVLGYVP